MNDDMRNEPPECQQYSLAVTVSAVPYKMPKKSPYFKKRRKENPVWSVHWSRSKVMATVVMAFRPTYFGNIGIVSIFYNLLRCAAIFRPCFATQSQFAI